MSAVSLKLSPSQREAFEAVKQKVIDEKLVVPAEDLIYRPEDQKEYDDTILIRYLRARRWQVEGAMQQLRATSEWFIQEDVERHYDEMPIDEFRKTSVVYPRWTGGRSRQGNMVFVYRLDQITDERIKKYNDSPVSVNTRANVATRFATSFYFPLANALPRPDPSVRIDRSVSIVDMSGVGVTRFWTIRGLLQGASEIPTAHLPEGVGKIFIVGAPSIWSMIFNIIKRWFDEGTTAKIEVLAPSAVFERLSLEIDPKSIPKCYGGESDWNWENREGDPVLDEDIMLFLGLESKTELPDCPLRFHHRTGLSVVGTGRGEDVLKYNSRGGADLEALGKNGAGMTEGEPIAEGQPMAELGH